MTSVREIALPTYRVTIAAGALDRAADVVRDVASAHRYAIITDSNVGPIYSARLRSSLGESCTEVLTIPAGETHKTRDSWARLTDELLTAGFGRDSTIVALGGGVVGDLAGFVAATFMRGVPFVQLPTTLLAMIDASVGGKTGVDTVAGKNLVGAFHQPSAVIVDTSVLETLPREHLRAGIAEAIKHGVIASEAYFDSVVALAERLDTVDVAGDAMLDLVAGSIEIKADVVRRDEREAGVRKTLNFGHTLGHAVELCSGYRRAARRGGGDRNGLRSGAWRNDSESPRRKRRRGFDRRSSAPGLSDTLPASIAADEVVIATRGDKKARAGQAEYALPAAVGEMNQAQGRWSVPVNEAIVLEVLA